MDNNIGKTLGGRYDIKEIVGVGGMAVVYKAFDTETHKNVALKLMKDEYLHNEEFARRFRNESKAVSILNHKNIVKILDVSLTGDTQYIVMELVEGDTLKSYIDNQGKLPWKTALNFIIQILKALNHAHGKGIIHRDIKPQNIIMLENKSIKVADFGIARFYGSETRTIADKAIGSVHYISPEQARGDDIDTRADIYSVGVMLYEMLTGKLPFEAENPVSVALMQLQNEPIPPRERNEAIPVGLEEIIMKAMQKNPKDRYQTVAEMLKDIDAFRKDPKIVFSYDFFVDDSPTRYVDTSSAGGGSSSKKKRRKDDFAPEMRSPIISSLTGIVLAFIIVAAVIVIISMDINNVFDFSKPNEVALPDFIGQQFDTISKDKQYAFEFLKEDEFSAEIPMGQVMRQIPPKGKLVFENTTITLIVSKGKERLLVPDIIGQNFTEGSQTLIGYNLSVNRIDVYDNELPEEYIIETTPLKNTEVASGSVVDVYVSIGPKPENMTMPDFENKMTIDQAKAKIISMGLTMDTPEEKDSDRPKGTILSQDPKAGTAVKSGDVVHLVISNGAIQAKTVLLKIDMPEGVEKRMTLEIVQDGISVKEDQVLPSIVKEYEYTASGSGTQEILIILDNREYVKYSVNFETGAIKVLESNRHKF
ncbi:MAG: Stk1 family PASTA domain-containing Ser/Thr kinase [Oscillospiraceae bacterium]|jgi:serine/threonine-protein kinase|nr:Stk1 family PASTA domain-containing Ser/Thr kinase [Oscillospiraceae bacterium]